MCPLRATPRCASISLELTCRELVRTCYDCIQVYALAADAYKALCTQGTSQTLVTSGESGSGKTENSKQVFRFLAEIAGVQGGGSANDVSMQDLLIHSNPLLEAFGNAKTLRNHNSSRFGKLVTVRNEVAG